MPAFQCQHVSEGGPTAFRAYSPGNHIDTATVTAPEPGQGTVQCFFKPAETPVQLVLDLVSPLGGVGIVMHHQDQADGEYAFLLSGIKTPDGETFDDFAIRFTLENGSMAGSTCQA